MQTRPRDIKEELENILSNNNLTTRDIYHLINPIVPDDTKKKLIRDICLNELKKTDTSRHGNACLILGQQAWITNHDNDEVIIYFTRGKHNNHIPCMVELGRFYSIETNEYDKAIIEFDLAIESNNTAAMNNRATMHYLGYGGEVNQQAAIDLFNRAIKLDDPNAPCNLALLYFEQADKDANLVKTAIELFRKAITLNNPIAMTEFSTIYIDGKFKRPNYLKAAKLLRQAYGSYDRFHGFDLFEKMSSIFNILRDKTDDFHVNYHLHLTEKITDTLPKSLIDRHQQYPDEIEFFIFHDELFTEREKRIATNYIGQYYFNLAKKTLANHDIEQATFNKACQLFEKIPENADCYLEAHNVLIDILFTSLEYIDNENIPYTLKKIFELHHLVLRSDLCVLDSKLNAPGTTPAQSDELSRLIINIDTILISNDSNVAIPFNHHLTTEEQHYHRYVSHLNMLHDYTAKLKKYLLSFNTTSNKCTRANLKVNSLWQKEQPHWVKRLKNLFTLLSTKEEAFDILNIAAQICEHLSSDTNEKKQSLLDGLPMLRSTGTTLSVGKR